jgi:Cu/Zn superoxide dismutase
MTTRALLIAFVIAACGGGKKAADKPAPKTEPAEAPMAKKTEPEKPAEAPKPPPPPKMWHAKASLDPVKGAKQKSAAISFSEEEGKSASASGSIEGLKPGKYHLVVHEAKDCGPNGTKAGKAKEGSVDFEVAKGAAGTVGGDVSMKLDGDDSIVGHALVLHDDAKGKPGKTLACGVVSAMEDEDDAAKKE